MIFGIEAKTVLIIVGSIIFVSPIFLFSFRINSLYQELIFKLQKDYPETANQFKSLFERRGLYFFSGFPIPVTIIVYRPFKTIKYLEYIKAQHQDGELNGLVNNVNHNLKFSVSWLLVIIFVLLIYFSHLVFKLVQ